MSLEEGLAQLKIADPIYSPIASQDGVIRVLKLLPGQFADEIFIRLHSVFLKRQSVSSYNALSYVWGVGASTSRVWIDDRSGQSLPITANLESALRYLRLPDGERTLWIDALCINQMDFEERSAQVQLMGEIYTAADNVIIWLGAEDDSVKVKSCLHLLQEAEALSHPLRREDIAQLAPAIYRLLGRPWFQRTWVVQELALAHRDPVIFLSRHSFPWASFMRCARLVLRSLDQVSELKVADYQERFERADSFDAIRLARREPSRQENAFFAYQLRRTLYLSATDPRDKIFGLLGIAEFESEQLLADYKKSICEVYAEATSFMLRKGYVSMYFESPLRPLQDRHVGLHQSSEWPSWVPNFTFAIKTIAYHRSFNAARRSYTILLEAPMDNLPLMLNIRPEERVDMLAQDLPPSLMAAQFSTDNTCLSTYGLYAGTIIATSIDSLRYLDWAEPPWLSLNSVYDIYHDLVAPNKISPADYLCALLPQEHRYSWRIRPGAQQHEAAIFDSFLNADRDQVHSYGALFRRRDDVEPGPFGQDIHDTMQELAEAISSHVKDRIIFVTDKGHVGLTYHEEPQTGIREGDVLVGLFGVNFPFVLRQNKSDDDKLTHQMINVASVANHQWGHEFLGNTFTASGYPAVKSFRPDTTWKDFEVFGMEEYVIV